MTYRLRMMSMVALIAMVGSALASDFALGATTAYDGEWSGRVLLSCGVRGKIDVIIKNGIVTGHSRVSGRVRGDYTISGEVTPTGNLVNARMIGQFVLPMSGSVGSDSGSGMFLFDDCPGEWNITLDKRAAPEPVVQVVPTPTEAAPVAEEKPAPVAEKPAEIKEAQDTDAPTIAVPSAIKTRGDAVEIAGVVRDRSAVIDFRIDGQAVALDSDGRFRYSQAAPEGISEITLAALDEWGNEATRVVQITRIAPPKTPPKTESTTRDADPPRIDVADQFSTETANVSISGRITDESAVSQFLINDRPVPLDSEGHFRVERQVPSGNSAFRLAAVDEWGNRSEKNITVSRPASEIVFGDFHALVIGNNDYAHLPRLKTARDDAEAIGDVLEKRYGFTVTRLINATRYDVLSALNRYRADLAYDDNLLIYYAGHGIVDPVTERGYWLPVDAEQSISANWISNADITDMVKAISARHVLVIADSCYSGMLTRSVQVDIETWEDRRAWIERIVDKRSRTAFSSGGLEPVNDGGGGRHSVFAKSLIDALKSNTRLIDAQALFAPVRRQVVLNANQTPQYADIRLAGHEGGDFVFAPQ